MSTIPGLANRSHDNNLDWAEEDLWRFYNQRCVQENYIKEMKRGFGMDRINAGFFNKLRCFTADRD